MSLKNKLERIQYNAALAITSRAIQETSRDKIYKELGPFNLEEVLIVYLLFTK